MTHFIKILFAIFISSVLLACSSTNQVVKNDGGNSRYAAEFKDALTAMQAGDIESAKTALIAITEKAPNYSGPWTNLGIISAGQRQYDQAENYFYQALKCQERNTVAMNWLGYLSSVKKDFSAASNWYSRAIAIDPKYAEAHLNLAMLYETNLNRPKAALDHYRIYQTQTGGKNTLVSAWIRNLEESMNYVATNSEVVR
jgi:Tfp pilus assembly protein PilF